MNKIAVLMMLLSLSAMADDDYPSMEEQMRESYRDSEIRAMRNQQDELIYEQRKQTQIMREQADMQRMNWILESKPGYLPDSLR